MKTRKKVHINFDSPQKQEQIESSHSSTSDSELDPTFPLTKTIQNMLYVYGDKKQSEVHNLAHLQIQELISGIFAPQIMKALFLPMPKPWIEQDIEEKLEFPIANAKHKKTMQIYLNIVFKEFVKLYQKLSKISKPLKKVASECNQKSKPEIDNYESALKNKAEQENLIFQEEQYSQGEESFSESSASYQQQEQQIWEQYMKDRVEQMQSKEFIKFMELRSQTFILHKKFKSFIDPHQYGQNFIDCINLKFLNYCLCRVLKQIIQQVMQQEPPKMLEFCLKEEHLKKIGYNVIETYKLRAKKYALQDIKLSQMAYNIFQKEFHQGYDKFFSSKLILQKNGILQLSQNQEIRAQEEWEKMGNLKSKWIDRVKAQKQVRQLLIKKMHVTPNTAYSKILLKKIEGMNYDQAKIHFSEWFKEWFIHLDKIEEIDSIYD